MEVVDRKRTHSSTGHPGDRRNMNENSSPLSLRAYLNILIIHPIRTGYFFLVGYHQQSPFLISLDTIFPQETKCLSYLKLLGDKVLRNITEVWREAWVCVPDLFLTWHIH